MPATVSLARPILSRMVLGTGTAVAPERRLSEKAAQTFLQGVPVQVDVAGATGFVIECPAMTSVATAKIAGMSVEGASNLTTSGVAKTLSLVQKPPNQPLANIIPIGAPPNDGTVGLVTADETNLFIGVLGNSSDNTLAIVAQTMIASIFGLTKDAGNGFWYVDQFKTTAATGACVEIVGLESNVGVLNGLVRFRVTQAAQQLGA